jgi:hypothetical protein
VTGYHLLPESAPPSLQIHIAGTVCYADCRPVAVIDPEDAEQVERLARAYFAEFWSRPLADDGVTTKGGDHFPEAIHIDSLSAALREFARPTPPRPEEPTGLGAVVKDADGYLWTCAVNENRRRWWNPLQGGWCDYADLAAVEVLSWGVEV